MNCLQILHLNTTPKALIIELINQLLLISLLRVLSSGKVFLPRLCEDDRGLVYIAFL